jgi:hypothetical protein
MNLFCVPFDLKEMDLESERQHATKTLSTIRMRNARYQTSAAGGPQQSKSSKLSCSQDIAFLRQLLEDGNQVFLNTKDKNILYDKEISDKILLEAALEASPDDAQTLLLMGNFEKKLFTKKKPRPRDILSGKDSKKP